MNKITTAEKAIEKIKDGDVLLVGGFLTTGNPETLLGVLKEKSTAKDLTIVSNDTGTTATNTIKIIEQGRVSKVYATYIGANPATGQMLLNDAKSVELVPQGTLAERIRCAGAGIPAFYTPVGAGTIVAEGKETRVFNGKEHLLEYALKGDVALVRATIADEHGNCFMKGTSKNFNTLMPRAAKYVIAEAEQIVKAGELDPELVSVPGIFIDALVQAEV